MARRVLSRPLSRDDLSEGTIVWLPKDAHSESIRCISNHGRDNDGFIQDGGRNHPVVVVYRSPLSNHVQEVAFVLVRSFGNKSLDYWIENSTSREGMITSIPIIHDFESRGHGNTFPKFYLENRQGRLNKQSYVRYDNVYIARFDQLRAWAPVVEERGPERLRLDHSSRVTLLALASNHSLTLSTLAQNSASHPRHILSGRPLSRNISELETVLPEVPDHSHPPSYQENPNFSTQISARGGQVSISRLDPASHVVIGNEEYGTFQVSAVVPNNDGYGRSERVSHVTSRLSRTISMTVFFVLLICNVGSILARMDAE